MMHWKRPRARVALAAAMTVCVGVCALASTTPAAAGLFGKSQRETDYDSFHAGQDACNTRYDAHEFKTYLAYTRCMTAAMDPIRQYNDPNLTSLLEATLWSIASNYDAGKFDKIERDRQMAEIYTRVDSEAARRAAQARPPVIITQPPSGPTICSGTVIGSYVQGSCY